MDIQKLTSRNRVDVAEVQIGGGRVAVVVGALLNEASVQGGAERVLRCPAAPVTASVTTTGAKRLLPVHDFAQEVVDLPFPFAPYCCWGASRSFSDGVRLSGATFRVALLNSAKINRFNIYAYCEARLFQKRKVPCFLSSFLAHRRSLSSPSCIRPLPWRPLHRLDSNHL